MTSMEIYIFSSSSSLPDIVDLFFPHLHPFTQLLNAFIESCAYLRDTYKSTVHNILNMLKKKHIFVVHGEGYEEKNWTVGRDESDVEIKHRPASMFIHLMSLNGIHSSTRSFSFQCCFCFSRFFSLIATTVSESTHGGIYRNCSGNFFN